MKKLQRLPLVLMLCALATCLCGCPALDHKIFVRNMTADTARFTLILNPLDTSSKRNIAVRSTNEIVPVKKKTISRLDGTVNASVGNDKVTLIIPPKSTIFVSDVLKAFSIFDEKTLVMELAGRSDTMIAGYPYKELKGFRRKFDPSYNYFYRTIVYYDIK